MTSATPGISIVIVSYNVRPFLDACLESIALAQKKLQVPSEILVVDNCSRDDTLSILKPKFPEVRWKALDKNLGFGSACNRGAQQARHQVLLFLNPDTLLESDTLASIWELTQTTPRLGVAGCRILNRDHSFQLASKRSFPSPAVALYKLLGLSKLFPKSPKYARYNLTYLDENKDHEVDSVSGSFMCIPKKVFDAVGGFDEDFFMYGEDLDLCYRIKKNGYIVLYTPRTSIVHFKGESAKSRPLLSWIHFYSAMVIFSRKHFEKRTLPTALVVGGVFSLGTVRFLAQWGKKWQRWALDLSLANGLLFFLTYLYAKLGNEPPIFSREPGLYLRWHFLISVCFGLMIGSTGDYGSARPGPRKSTAAIIGAVLLFYALGYFIYEESYSRIVIGFTGVFSALALTGWRWLEVNGSAFFSAMMRGNRRTVLVGINPRGLALRDLMSRGQIPGHEFLGFFSHPSDLPGREVGDFIGEVEQMPSLLKKLEVHEIIVVAEKEAYDLAVDILSRGLNGGMPVKILVGEPHPGSLNLVDLSYAKS